MTGQPGSPAQPEGSGQHPVGDSPDKQREPARPGHSSDGRAGQPGTGAAGRRLRSARQARGLSQGQLARMAQISRQAVSAIEAGLSDPSLRVALTLSRALGLTVEDLFGPAMPEPAVPVRALAPLGGEGSRVSLAPIGEALVALPQAGASITKAGFAPAGGRVSGPEEVVPLGPLRPTLLVAGCDPALPLLELPLSLLDPPVEFLWWPCASQEALSLAAAGLVHVAGAHLRDRSGDYNTSAAGELLREGAEVIGFSSWREGLVLRPEHAAQVGDVAGVVSAGLRLVNREPGSEARRVLDRELASLGASGPDLTGYDITAAGHLEVAAAIAAGLADAGVASEPAALAYDLSFVPLTSERFDLIIPASMTGMRETQALMRVLSSPWLLSQLASLPGYDVTQCGDRIASLGPA
jgi:molybdopterin molybdotransferase/putative molybdopterin biosynthesis protein